MSYDFEIATHQKPTLDQVRSWAAQHDLAVDEAAWPGFLAIERNGGRPTDHVCTLDGPNAAEAEDFAEDLAAACLNPRWWLQISMPYAESQANLRRVRSLAKFLAEQNEGAAWDPQQEKLIWPRGRPSRAPAPTVSGEETIDVVELEWFLPLTRWESAPELLVGGLARRCPEALPTRYGQWEPLQYRLDPRRPHEFSDYLRTTNDFVFWKAQRPCFGGNCTGPQAHIHSKLGNEQYRVATIQLTFDGRAVETDDRWREAIIDLFIAMAGQLGAFFAAGTVKTGHKVGRNNSLWAVVGETESYGLLDGMRWNGIPPVPLWLTWFGLPYKELVRDALSPERLALHAKTAGRPSEIQRVIVGIAEFDEPVVRTLDDGVFVRLSERPRNRRELMRLPLPDELMNGEWAPIGKEPRPVPGTPRPHRDRAVVIPDLSAH